MKRSRNDVQVVVRVGRRILRSSTRWPLQVTWSGGSVVTKQNAGHVFMRRRTSQLWRAFDHLLSMTRRAEVVGHDIGGGWLGVRQDLALDPEAHTPRVRRPPFHSNPLLAPVLHTMLEPLIDANHRTNDRRRP